MLQIADHPLLDAHVFSAQLPQSLGQIGYDGLQPGPKSANPYSLQADDEVRQKVRAMLRYSGFRPTGRNKPASEYLLKAVANETLAAINLAVDICNLVSHAAGLPISVVDGGKLTGDLSITPAAEAAEYVFNPSGQILKLAGLLCLHDAEGPCANGVKDSQRTKTDASTTSLVVVVWGSQELGDRAQTAATWFADILRQHGAVIEQLAPLNR